MTASEAELEARLEEVGPPVPDAGFLHTLRVARYSDPALTVAFEAGVLPDDAEPGDRHRIALGERVPASASYHGPWEPAGPVRYGLRVEVTTSGTRGS